VEEVDQDFPVSDKDVVVIMGLFAAEVERYILATDRPANEVV
jgi:hypothetical protein